MTVIAYIRVSTEKQNVANQQHELKNFAQNNQIQIDEWLKETISSRQPLEKRALGRRLKKMKKGDLSGTPKTLILLICHSGIFIFFRQLFLMKKLEDKKQLL